MTFIIPHCLTQSAKTRVTFQRIMLRTAGANIYRQSILRNFSAKAYRNKSTESGGQGKTGRLEADSGNLATHIHHKMTTFLAVTAPIYFFAPESLTNDFVDTIFGLTLAVNVSAHSWIGLNYVVTDYVPKISKAAVGPARLFSAGLGLVTVVGLGKIAMNGQGGIKSTILALWRGKDASDMELKKEQVS